MNKRGEKELALSVVHQLRDAGFSALWAGGCVRDLLMGHSPTDYDVATSATPQQVRQLFGHRRTLPVGVAFGVVIVLGGPGHTGQVEVATFRTDAAYSDGRHPDAVVFSTPREDAFRRDFTINGMFYDPLDHSVIDYVGGQADLQRRLLRAIGCADDRLGEDKLRMLRAVRFAARFDFEIEADTRQAIARHAAEVACVSGERVWMELYKTLATPRAAWAVQQWFELGLLQHLLPELHACWPEQRSAAMHLLKMLVADRPSGELIEERGAPPSLSSDRYGTHHDWLDRLCGLLWIATREEFSQEHASGQSMERFSVEAVVLSLKQRLKLSNEVSDTLRFCLAVQNQLEGSHLRPWSVMQPLLIHPAADRAVKLFAARSCLIDVRQAISWRDSLVWLDRKLALPPEQLDPPPLLSGQDLIALGLKPSPRFRELLAAARQQQLDQHLSDRPAALEWLREQVNDR